MEPGLLVVVAALSAVVAMLVWLQQNTLRTMTQLVRDLQRPYDPIEPPPADEPPASPAQLDLSAAFIPPDPTDFIIPDPGSGSTSHDPTRFDPQSFLSSHPSVDPWLIGEPDPVAAEQVDRVEFSAEAAQVMMPDGTWSDIDDQLASDDRA